MFLSVHSVTGVLAITEVDIFLIVEAVVNSCKLILSPSSTCLDRLCLTTMFIVYNSTADKHDDHC